MALIMGTKTVTELTFLLDLLLNHKLPMATRVAITERVKEVEQRLNQAPQQFVPRGTPAPVPQNLPPHLVGQSPSTIAAMMRNGFVPEVVREAQLEGMPNPPLPVPEQPTQPAIIAQTPAAMAALNDRQAAISQAISGKPEKGRTSPRKF